MGKCKECEFCFFKDNKYICADVLYGEIISDSLIKDKECYSESFNIFLKNEKAKIELFQDDIRLNNLKINKNKRIYLQDLSKCIISIKFKYALEKFCDVRILKSLDYNTYQLKCFFDEELTKGSNYVYIK